MKISEADIVRIDLNLLTSLDILLTVGSVTKAADALSLTQSAMSYNLARLRKLFGDELLTRTAGGMKATPYARTLQEPLSKILREVNALVAREIDFDPRQAVRSVRIGVHDSSELLLIPAVLSRLQRDAPGIQLDLKSIDRMNVLDELDAGTLDMAIGVFSDGQVHHKRRLLHADSYLCIFNPKLLDMAMPLTRDAYLSIPHVMTRTGGQERDPVGEELAKLNLNRTVVLSTAHLFTIPFFVRDTPVLATVHAKMALYFAEMLGLAICVPPLALPSVPVSLLWHASYDKDPAHMWLRKAIVQAMQEVVSANAEQTGAVLSV